MPRPRDDDHLGVWERTGEVLCRLHRREGIRLSDDHECWHADAPKRLEVRDLQEGAVVKLGTERKHLTDIVKMVAYQAESDLLALLRPHYARVDQEGRTLLHDIFAAAGDIEVSGDELHVTLAPLSSPHRTRAAQALCESLNKTATVFPGSRLRIRFDVHPPPLVGLAFPGSPAKGGVASNLRPESPQTGHFSHGLCQEV